MLHLSIALNSESSAKEHRMALNVELPGGNVPEWVQLIPAGPTVTGQDGRSWRFGEVEARSVLAWFSGRGGAPLLMDWEHASERLAPQGKEAPAAGWITALELRDGALWGRVEWTERAAGQVSRKEYRFLSPVFLHTKDDRRILKLVSIALTNTPNFLQTALNQERQEVDMDLTALFAALGLSAGSTLEQVVTAVNSLKTDLVTARNQAETPSLDKYVPRADYQAAVLKAENAASELASFKKAQQDAEVEAIIETGLKDGKVTPATKDFYKAQCQQEGGLARLKEFLKVAPVIGGDSGLEGKKPESQSKALNAEERKLSDLFGHSAEDLAKYGQA
ncbi:phage protease [Desulfocurvibacter africanus]|nr:phage protease [Desulfocurvibacter africanus]